MGKWETVRLGDVCDGISSNIALKDLENNEGIYPIYGAGGFIKNVDFYRQEKEYIAVVKDGAGIGRTMILPAKSSVIGTMQTILPTLSIDTKYLYYAMGRMGLAKYCTGATIPHIYFKDYKKEILPLPPLPVQQQIADVLDRASALIEKRKAQIEKLDLLVKSQFIEMFGDLPKEKYVTIARVCSIITDGTHQPPKFVATGIPFLFVSNIVSNKVTYDAEKFISEETYEKLIKRTPIEVGDILLSTVGSYGHPAVVKTSERFCFQRHIAYLKPKHELMDSNFFYGALLSPTVQRQIEERVKGVAQKTLNLSEIRKIIIPLPILDEQRKYSAFIQTVEAQKALLQQSIAKLEQNYKSLMQKCFRGEIF